MKKFAIGVLVFFSVCICLGIISSRNRTEKTESSKTVAPAEAKPIAYTSDFRKLYQTELRNHFLDKGLDIKVAVKGKKRNILELQFALFNDVWMRKFETTGSFEEWHKLGFKKIVLTDGYEYNKYYSWNN